ncbi:MAG: hypothetical protein GEU90_11665 [Gemmatimonas sp.]|nr:hypothetical protein [Gemmatimonas sp.]
MSRKSDREQQKRRQRKQERQAAKRKRSRGRAQGGRSNRGLEAFDPQRLATMFCIVVCQSLLAGAGRFDPEERSDLLRAAYDAGGIWQRLLVELERFLYEDKPWSLTCADLAPVRAAFAANAALDAFDHLWVLALTNESADVSAFAAADVASCAYRAARAFDALRASLDDPDQDPAQALTAVVDEMDEHGAGAALKKSYKKLLSDAVASLHAPARLRRGAVTRLARSCAKLFEREARRRSSTAWWQCGRLFLTEVFDRHQCDGFDGALAGYPGLLAELVPPPRALLWMAEQEGSVDRLRSVPFQSTAESWLSFLRQHIDPGALDFEERVRLEIVRVKLMRARARTVDNLDESAVVSEHHEFLTALADLRTLLAHGVPPDSRALPGILEPALVDFYVGAIDELQCHDAALPITEDLRRCHPDDFRLACLYATAALMRRERHRLRALQGHPPRSHVDPELFGRCARIWEELPQGTGAVASARSLLFEGLDREDRKRCLLKLAQQALWRAHNLDTYRQELRSLLPYFESDNFVYRDIEEKAALDPGLVFCATMMAPFHERTLSLDETQSQQWVSHLLEIARQSPLGARLAKTYLATPSPWFTLAPTVASAARAHLEELRPSAGRSPDPEPAARPPDPKRNTGRRRPARQPRRPAADDSTAQPSLFDALDP